MTRQIAEPRTAAGRALLAAGNGEDPIQPDDWFGAILAIEAEAAQAATVAGLREIARGDASVVTYCYSCGAAVGASHKPDCSWVAALAPTVAASEACAREGCGLSITAYRHAVHACDRARGFGCGTDECHAYLAPSPATEAERRGGEGS